MQWDEELPFIGSEMSGFDEAYVSEVIKTCLALGLFDKDVFDREQVLTSKGIQERYCNIQRLNKRMSRIDKYSLLPEPQQRPSLSKKAKPKSTKTAQASTHQQSEKPQPATPTPPPTPTPQSPTSTADGNNAEWLKEFFSDNHSENLNLLCKNFGLQPGDMKRLRSLADAVVAEWELSHTEHRDYSDWSRHLISSMRIKNRDDQRPQSAKSSSKNPDPQTSDYTYKGGFGGVDI